MFHFRLERLRLHPFVYKQKVRPITFQVVHLKVPPLFAKYTCDINRTDPHTVLFLACLDKLSLSDGLLQFWVKPDVEISTDTNSRLNLNIFPHIDVVIFYPNDASDP